MSSQERPLVPQPDDGVRELPLHLHDGVVTGWRCWRVEISDRTATGDDVSGELLLTPIAKAGHWPPRRPLTAICQPNVIARFGRPAKPAPPPHRSPWGDGDCQCGIWAFPTSVIPRVTAVSYCAIVHAPFAWAIGQVSLWGRIVVREKGYLAEHAYPASLTLLHMPTLGGPPRDILEAAAAELAASYGVPADIADLDEQDVLNAVSHGYRLGLIASPTPPPRKLIGGMAGSAVLTLPPTFIPMPPSIIRVRERLRRRVINLILFISGVQIVTGLLALYWLWRRNIAVALLEGGVCLSAFGASEWLQRMLRRI